MPNARTDERAVFFGQMHAGEGHVSAIEQIKSRGGQQLIKTMGVVTGADGRIGRTADRMANWSAVALPGMAGLHTACTDERAAFIGQIHAGEGRVSAIEQIKSRGGQQLIKKMGVVTDADDRINIDRNALGAIEKITHCDRTDAGMRLRSSKRRQTQIGARAIQRADGLVLRHAERLAATRFADMGCESLRKSSKDMRVGRSVDVCREVARRAGLNLCVGKIQRLRVRRRFAFAHTLPSAELCEGRTQNFAQVGDAPHFAIGPLALHATREFGLGRKICPPTTNPAATFHAPAVEQLKNSPSADAILSRLRSPTNPNTAFSAIHGTFHTQNLESTGINHEALCGISRRCNAKRKEHLTNVVRQVRVSRVVKYMFQRQPSVRHESKDGRESFMCFGPESSRDARDGFAETWRRGTDIYRGLRRLRQRVKARVLDIAQEVGHGQCGFAKGAVVVEHPSGQHCFGGFFEPLVDQNSNFSPQIRRVIEAGQFKRLQGSS